MKKKILFLILIVFSFVVVKADVDIESLATVGGNTRRVAVGEKTTIGPVFIIPDNATNKKLIWTSSDTKIATIDSTGIVTGKSLGTVTITATAESNSEAKVRFELVVTSKKTFDANGGVLVCTEALAGADSPSFEKINDSKVTMLKGKGTLLSDVFVDTLPEFGNGCIVYKNGYIFKGWESRQGENVTLLENSKKLEDIPTDTVYAVWEKDPVQITFNDTFNCKPGETIKNAKMSVSPSNSTLDYEVDAMFGGITVKDSELQPNCIGCRLVDITCNRGGNSTIILTSGTTKFRSKVVVSKVEGLSSYMNTIRMAVGESRVFPLTVFPESEKSNVTWFSSNGLVASVDEGLELTDTEAERGKVKAKSVGIAQITAQASDNFNVKYVFNLEVLNKKVFDSNGGELNCSYAFSNSETPIITQDKDLVTILGDNDEKISDFIGTNKTCTIKKDGYTFNGWFAEESEGKFVYYDNSTKFEDLKQDKLQALWTKIKFPEKITCKPGEVVKHVKIDTESFPIYGFTYKSNDTSIATISDSTDLQVNCINCRLVDISCKKEGNTTISINLKNVEFTSKVVVGNEKPSAPSVTLKKGSNNSLVVSYKEVESVSEYLIYRSTKEKSGYKKIATTKELSYTDKKLTYGTTYYYKVKTKNDIGLSSYSKVVKAKVIPDKVTGLDTSSVKTNSIKLSWNKVSVTGYVLQRSLDEKKWTTIKTITSSKTLSFNNTGLKANTKYSYRIRAYKTVNGKKIYGKYSDIVSDKTAPSKPTIAIKAADFDSLKVVISKKISGANKYIVYRSTSKAGKYTKVGETTSTTFTDKSLSTGQTYFYKAKACNNNNKCSGYSNIVSKKPVIKVPKVTLESSNKGRVISTITMVDGADSFEIYRSTSKTGKYTRVTGLMNVFTSDGVVYQGTQDLISGKTYYYKGRACSTTTGTKICSSYTSIKSIKCK